MRNGVGALKKGALMKTLTRTCMTSAVALGLACLLTGCDREVSHTEKTTVKSDGTVQKKETTVKQAPDGTVTKEESEKTARPPNP
jgi:hypothetical protein